MKVRLGIIGVGYWGPNLVRSFFHIENCEVVICSDLDKKKLSQINRQFPSVETTQDTEKILKDKTIDAVVIATPSNTHVTLVKKALENQKHVFVEKPFTLSVKEADQIIILNKKNKRIILVGHTYEYHPAILKIKEYIDRKELGDLFYIYCSRTNMGKVREETNALWNLAPHDVSVLNYLLDAVPLKVCAYGQSYLQKKQEDVVFVNLKYPRNVIAHIHVSWLDPSKERKMTVIGSKKMVVFDDLDNEASLKIYDKGFIKLVNEKGERLFKEFSLKLRPGDIHVPYIMPEEPLKKECEHFIDCINSSKRPKTDEKNGRRTVSVLEAAQKSLSKGGSWISVI